MAASAYQIAPVCTNCQLRTMDLSIFDPAIFKRSKIIKFSPPDLIACNGDSASSH